MTKSRQELLTEVQKASQALHPSPLITRSFVSLEGSAPEPSTLGLTDKPDGAVRVMQWNLLAQGLCLGSDGFILCPPEALSWQRRQHHVMEELLTYDCDVLCLQEVDNFDLINTHLAPLGYAGLFCPKPDSPCLYMAGNHGPDGCAVFWKTDCFTLKSHDNMTLKKDNGSLTNQVALVCLLELVTGSAKGQEVVVTATHLKSKHNWGELRAQQGKWLEQQLVGRVGPRAGLLCGDFNAEPQEEVIKVMKGSSLTLTSAYTHLDPVGGSEPPYTTWKVRSGKPGKPNTETCHTIDYMFYTTGHMKVAQLLTFPSGQELGPGLLPSWGYPSDHLSLVADFVFT